MGVKIFGTLIEFFNQIIQYQIIKTNNMKIYQFFSGLRNGFVLSFLLIALGCGNLYA